MNTDEILVNHFYEHVDTKGSCYEVAALGKLKMGADWVPAVIYRKAGSYTDHFIRTAENFADRFTLISNEQ